MSNQFRIKPIRGYEDTHLVTDDGRVFRKTRLGGELRRHGYHKYVTKTVRGGWVKPQKNSNGYLHINIGTNKVIKTIHRLVATTFLDNPDNKRTVNHKDGNKQNNSVNNLEWCTQSENMSHAYKTGLKVQKRGDKSYLTRIPENELQVIKDLYESGITQKQIAIKYGVDQSHISRIVNNHKKGRVTLCQI
jgi:hypothetical protein